MESARGHFNHPTTMRMPGLATDKPGVYYPRRWIRANKYDSTLILNKTKYRYYDWNGSDADFGATGWRLFKETKPLCCRHVGGSQILF